MCVNRNIEIVTTIGKGNGAMLVLRDLSAAFDHGGSVLVAIPARQQYQFT